MSTNLEMMDLYDAIIADCKNLLENNVDEKMNEKLEKIEPGISNYIDLYTEILKLSKKTNISLYGIKYLDNMSNYIYALKQGIKSESSLEHEIYSAYGFMWSFEYLYNLAKLEDICEFKLNKYKHFSSIFKDPVYSLKIKNNYEKNAKEIIGDKINEGNINKFLNIVIEKKLNKIKQKKKSKKNAKNKKQTHLLNENLTSTIMQKIDLMEKGPKKFEKDNTTPNSSQSQFSSIYEQKEEEKNDNLNNFDGQDELPNNPQITEINANSQEEKETKTNFELSQMIDDSQNSRINIQTQITEEAKDNLGTPENDNDIFQENENQDNIQQVDEVKTINEANQEIEENDEENIAKEDIINTSNKDNDDSDQSYAKDENVNIINNNSSKNISHEELISIAETLQNQLMEHEERIKNLEKNQKLLYYQLSMYQS